jgi:hypothetical protein
MIKIVRPGVVLLCVFIFNIGCRTKEPVLPASKANTSSDGPVLAPPQQAPPTTPQGGNAALPTEGDPSAKSASNQPATGPANSAPAPLPTEGDPTGTATAGDASKPASEDAAEAAKIKANLASMSAEDRAAVEKQKICPVSGEKLGTMGAPPKVKVAGHDVFICCKSCEEPLTKDPAKFLAKIGLEPNK